MDTNALLDAVKARFNIPSDYALAKFLKIEQTSVRDIRARGLSEERALQIATLLELPEGEVLASIRAERAKDPAVKAAWKKVAESVRTALGLAAFVAVLLVTGTPPKTANASEALGAPKLAPAIHYARNRRKRLAARLACNLPRLLRGILRPLSPTRSNAMRQAVFALPVFLVALSACGGASVPVNDAHAETLPSIAQTTVSDGLYVTGVVPGTSANILAEGTSDVLVGLDRTGPANTTDEGAFYMRARDSGGTMRKTWSLSNKWVSADATNGYSVTRFNSGYMFNGVQIDDLSIRQFGGHGITLFGDNDTDAPPAGVSLLVRGVTRIGAEAQVYQMGIAYGSPEPAASANYAKLFVDSAGNLKIKFPNGSVFKIVLTQ